jgi:hypothetical protein
LATEAAGKIRWDLLEKLAQAWLDRTKKRELVIRG